MIKKLSPTLKQYSKNPFLGLLIGIMLYLSSPTPTLARWANFQDADIARTSISHIEVKKNGSSIEHQELTIKMLKERVKPYLAQYALQYNSDVSSIKIIEAKTLIKGQEYPVDLTKIETKPISSKSQAFDQVNQIIIPYPHLEINATIYLKYEQITTKSVPANAYLTIFPFYQDYYLPPNNITIRSELPLYVQKHDPEHAFLVTNHTQIVNNKRLSIVNIKQTKPFIKKIVNEEEEKHALNPNHLPIIAVSSMKNFKEYGQALSLEYDLIKQQPLPALYQEIAKVAKKAKGPIDTINTITSLLAEKITYLSNMQTIKGGLVPQSLQRVADTRLGDCKDFSMATATILDSLGFSTKIALVMRGEERRSVPTDLPGPGHFNHAILKVDLPKGPLWIDPTNFVSMANHTFPDIADKKVLVLDSKNSNYDIIPPIKPSDYQVLRREIWDMKDPKRLKVKGSLQLLGNAARTLTGQSNNASEKTLKNALIDTISESYGHLESYNMHLPNLFSRTVQDVKLDYEIITYPSRLKTNAGIAHPILFKPINHFIQKKDTVSDLYVGPPRIIETYSTLHPINTIGRCPLNCDIQSPWVSILRTVKYEKDHIEIHHKMEVKKSWIQGNELNSKAYQHLQTQINQNFHNGIAIISPTPNP